MPFPMKFKTFMDPKQSSEPSLDIGKSPMAMNFEPVFEALFPDDVITVESNLDEAQGKLYAEEAQYVEKVVEKRRKEFTAGRLCAREALARLGIERFPLLAADSRLPLWPDSVTGSISHTSECCGVVAASRTRIAGLGLDIELLDRVTEKLWSMIFTDPEQAWLRSLDTEVRARYASLIFSAKECFYKYQFPFTQQWLGFMDAHVHVAREDGGAKKGCGAFEIELLKNVDKIFREGERFEGAFLFSNNLVYTGMCRSASS